MKLAFTLLVSLLLAVPSLLRAQEVKQMTADQLVAKNIEAKGGAEALHALQTVKLTGKMLVNQGLIQLAYTETRKRPNIVRVEFSLQGMTAVKAFDGTEGWKISPFQGRKDPEKMSADDTKTLVEDAEIGGPLVDWKEKGSKVDYLGTEDVDGTPALQTESDAQERRHVTSSISTRNYFLEIRHRDPAHGTRRAGRSGDRPGRLRKDQRRFRAVLGRERDRKAIPTNRRSFSIKATATCRWTTPSSSFPEAKASK